MLNTQSQEFLTKEQIKEKARKGALTKLIKNGKACAWPRIE